MQFYNFFQYLNQYRFVEFFGPVKYGTGSLSFWEEIALSYWIWGVIFPLSFFNIGQKKSLDYPQALICPLPDDLNFR